VARRSRASRGAVWGPILLVLAVLAGAFGSFQYDVPRRLGWGDRASAPDLLAPPSGVTLPEFAAPAAVAAPLVATAPDPESIRTVLAPTLRDKDLGSHVVAAVADARGQVLFRGGTSPASTSAVAASTMKLLTASAALESLGPATTFRTKVVQGAAGEIVLVGGGDPYLTDNPLTDDDSDRPAPADLRTLARATATALVEQGTTRVKLGFDDSLFGSPGINPDWDPTDIPAGYAAPITALWSDQGHPDGGDVVTVKDPSQDAAQVFARALRAAGVQVAGTPRRTSAAAGAAEISGLDSARVDQIVDEVLASSDNEGAELLAHQVGVKEGFGGTFAGGLQGVTAVLGRLGVTLAPHDKVLDGSGLAPASRLTADTLLKVLALGVDPARPELRTVVTALPVAGFTGSLAERFEEGPVAGRGRAAAKTGTLTGVHALAGVATTPDGSTLLFVLMADKVKPEKALDAREALDVVVSTLASCLCS
jgi:D-alanyl-D-alanine carboxypeptidase/D-alanyl-D-alanine-endopeptidase (penicillin-binding protein 4)